MSDVRSTSTVKELLENEPGFAVTRKEIQERALVGMSKVERQERYERYFGVESLKQAIQSDDTVFVSLKWLMKRVEPLPKRQEMPPEAFIEPHRLVALFESSLKGRNRNSVFFPIISISHVWRTETHPDPNGETLRLIQSALKNDSVWKSFDLSLTDRSQISGVDLFGALVSAKRGQEVYSKYSAENDMGVFFDWCSLWQKPRTVLQRDAFHRGLEDISRWYAHRLTSVFFVTSAKVEDKTTGRFLGYHDKGWPTFEWALATMTKRAGSSGHSLVSLLHEVDGKRPLNTPTPPADPRAFYNGHRYGDKVYTNGADREGLVAPMFKKTVEHILSVSLVMDYQHQKWDDLVAARVGLILPLCFSLRKLLLSGVDLTTKGLRALVEPMMVKGTLPALEYWSLYSNYKLDGEAAKLLAGALEQGALESLMTLDVSQCGFNTLLLASGLNASYTAPWHEGRKALRAATRQRGISLECDN